jgi:replication initiation and membrane attachment protein DnaB
MFINVDQIQKIAADWNNSSMCTWKEGTLEETKKERKKGAKNKKKRENEKDSDQSTNLSETSTNLKYCLTGESSL